ncbi:Dinitrogenase iron-molybdenum cofactor [Vibrio mediterranei]|uniref:NifB/NifX family molybdenum-iron cluster-binding protein n=1 Tax=Vibrio mediterranei TaxID=689 RepID=UPI000784094C|nr:NifB/NifX family molybdenum-iron cluster-binding protein [Vibrio mediterranei]SBO11323.1 Dinitrogenase iron-molybdenum cofactor [Vibrio mediterranei]
MIVAIPFNNDSISSHFAKAPQILLVDTSKNSQHRLTLPDASQGGCGNKKHWLDIIKQYDVETVVVRNIGKKMLGALFNSGVNVRSAPVRTHIDDIDFDTLNKVESLDYGRVNKPKHNTCCSGHEPKRNKLAPSTVHHIKMNLKSIK